MRRLLSILAILLAVILLSVAALAITGLLRPVYFAAITEARLIRRGNSPVRIRFSPRDHMNQVFIPAGTFTMGADQPNLTRHKVYLDGYWIDQFTVTNTMYKLCMAAGKCRPTASIDTYLNDPAYADYPVHYVTWFSASDFCAWEGGHLPTEAQWEKAARGVQGYRYPWGDVKPDPGLLNYNNEHGTPLPSYTYWAGMSPYGLLNMAGNMQQWIADWYGGDYYLHSPQNNPTGPAAGELRVLRGGGFSDNDTEVQTFYRFKHDPTSAGVHRGIRCVMDQ